VLHGALAYYLFRTSPEADTALRKHLQGRTFYVDTTVLYALVARDGELAALRDDLLRLVKEFRCHLRVTTATLREFQESVAHYKSLLNDRGITDAAIARAVLTQDAIDELDDFRRGFYRAFLRDPSITPDIYALPYETIEEQLQRWGIGRAVELPTAPRKGPDGRWIQIEHVEEHAESLRRYLKKHPRVGSRPNSGVREELLRHDAMHVAWVEQERKEKTGLAVPTKPSQVGTWFLTRDRHLCGWDRQFVAKHREGMVPRCLGLEEWVETMAVFAGSIEGREAASAFALRLLALHSPPITTEEEPDADDLQEIGRAAQQLKLHPEEAARVAADHQLLKQLRGAQSEEEQFEAIRASVIRSKDEEIAALQAELAATTDEADRARAKEQLAVLERERATAQGVVLAEANKSLRDERRTLERDAAFGREVRERAPRAVTITVVVAAALVGAIALIPALWTDAGPLRRVLVAVLGTVAVATVALWLLGFPRYARKILVRVGGAGSAVLALHELWGLTASHRRAPTAPPRPSAPPGRRLASPSSREPPTPSTPPPGPDQAAPGRKRAAK
jgi:hypothetical protein